MDTSTLTLHTATSSGDLNRFPRRRGGTVPVQPQPAGDVMPRYFLTKVWGFSPEHYPVLGFNDRGGRDKFLRESTTDDWVIYAGTLGPETDDGKRGRLLGMVRLGRDEVDVEAVLNSMNTPIQPHHRNADGTYRWPLGLPMLEAIRFPDQPDIKELFGDYLPGVWWASYALDIEAKIGPDAAAKVLGLRSEPAAIGVSPIIAREQNYFLTMDRNRRGATGPPPSSDRAAVHREIGGGWTYVFRLVGPSTYRPTLPVFKVGFTSHVEKRLGELNAGLVTCVTGFRWQIHIKPHEFLTEVAAHRFEQALHARLFVYRVEGEREIYRIAPGQLETEWVSTLASKEWA